MSSGTARPPRQLRFYQRLSRLTWRPSAVTSTPVTVGSGVAGRATFAGCNTGQFAAWLHAEVSCGQLTTGGTETVDGVSAVRLTASNKQETLSYWVNPTTYLPVRVTVAIPCGILMQDDLQWLPPTAANLAKLNLPVPPAGFTQVPSNGCIASGTCSP